MNLEKRQRSGKRNESRDLVRPIVFALNRIRGVRVTRNANLGPVIPYEKRFDPGIRPIVAGLGTGSADIVGICMSACTCPTWRPHQFGRVFCLEVKLPRELGEPVYSEQGDHVGWRPAKKAGALKPDQRRWLGAVRRFGGFAAVVHSVEEALACVVACREGKDGST